MKIKPLMIMTCIVTVAAAGCNPSNSANEPMVVGSTNSPATNTWQSVKESTTNALADIKEGTTNAWANVKEGATNAWANVKDSMRSATDYTYDKKDDFMANASKDLDALDQKMKEMSDKVASASDNIRADAKDKLETLRGKREKLSQKLDEAKNSAEANWVEVKAGFQTAYDDAKNSMKDAWDWLTDKLGK